MNLRFTLEQLRVRDADPPCSQKCVYCHLCLQKKTKKGINKGLTQGQEALIESGLIS